MAIISKSGMSLNTEYHLGQTLLLGSVITKYTLTPDSTVTINHGYPAGINVTIYNGTDAATEAYLEAVGYGTSGPYTVTSFFIPPDKITNTSAFQSSDLIKVEGTYRGTGITGDPTYTVEIEYTAPTLTWSNASLSLSQSASSLQITATMGGTATHSAGITVVYYLYDGSTQIGTFSNGSLTFTSTVGDHAYKVIAAAGGLTADGASTSFPVVDRLTWTNPGLSLLQEQNTFQVTATMSGTATYTGNLSVSYYLYEDTRQIGTFNNGTLTFKSSTGSHTYKTVASAGGLIVDGTSSFITVEEPPLVWHGAYLSLTQTTSTPTVLVMMGGTATHTSGETVSYYLYEGNTQIGKFTTDQMTINPTVGVHTYRTIAEADGIEVEGASSSIKVSAIMPELSSSVFHITPAVPVTFNAIINTIYPVGSVYISTSSASPATLFPGTTWTRLKDKFLLGAGDTYEAAATGGSASVSYTPAGSVDNHTLTTEEIPSHAHGLNSHTHSVGAHSHGLNSHKHSVAAHSHGLNSHKHSVGAHAHSLNSHTHSVGAHSHGLNSHVHSLNSHTHTGPSHSHTVGILTSSDATVTNGGYRLKLSTSYAAGSGGNGYTWMNFKSGGTSADNINYISNSGTGNTGAASGNTGAASGSTANSSAFNSGASSGNTANSSAFDSGAASGSTANSTAFDSGAASGSTANSTAFDSGAATGNTASAGSGGAHNHGFTGTAATIATMPPYVAVYMWERTA